MFGEDDDTCDQCGLDPCGCASNLRWNPASSTSAIHVAAPTPATPVPVHDAGDKKDGAFETFHKANPHVGAELLRLARARLARGEKRIGTKALFEELRGVLSTRSPDYRLNNNMTAPYARWLIKQDARLATAIELRRSKAE